MCLRVGCRKGCVRALRRMPAVRQEEKDREIGHVFLILPECDEDRARKFLTFLGQVLQFFRVETRGTQCTGRRLFQSRWGMITAGQDEEQKKSRKNMEKKVMF